MTHGQSQAQFGYLFTFVLALFIAGCGGGDDSSGVSSVSVNELELSAAPGEIVVVTVGETATLNASASTASSGESVSYAWEFRSKPHGSTASLSDATSATPTFNADVKGTYRVELVVSARGVVDSQSNIAYVEAVDSLDDLTTPILRNHQRFNSWCFECHIQPASVVEKTGDHLATTNMCQACHTIFTFQLNSVSFNDHQEVIGIDDCESCHDNVSVFGKSDNHVTTEGQCGDCHIEEEIDVCATFMFVDLNDCSYEHAGIISGCDNCHDGDRAIGKNHKGFVHMTTTSDCITCHNTDAFSPSEFDHSEFDNNCAQSGCHTGIEGEATGQSVGHPDTTAVTSLGTNCNICHNTQSFSMGDTFNHAAVLSSDLACDACHDGPNALATVKTPDHIDNLGADCGDCHNTTSFNPPFEINHSDPVVTSQACVDCHDNNPIIGVHANHVPTAVDCDICHTPGTFTSGVFDHLQANTTINPIAGNCTACHNNAIDAIVSGLPNNHVPTNNAECDACHLDTTYSSFAGAIFDHASLDPNNPNCAECHDSGIALGKDRDHIPTSDDCSVCHSTTVFTTFAGIRVHDSAADTSNCESCHNSTYATGKPRSTHIPTQANCSDCHDVAADFTSTTKFMNNVHANITNGCGGCHRDADNNNRFSTSNGLVPGKASTHVPTRQDCDACHITTEPFTTATFSHLGITGDCVSCHHVDTFAGIGALPMPADDNHLGVTADCGICHSADNDPGTGAPSFTYNVFDHTGNIANCASCHNGTDAGGKPNDTIHNNSVEDCGVCHVPGTFATAVFSHEGITDNCALCHGNTPTATPAPNDDVHNTTTQDCSACHNTTEFAGAQFNHSGILDGCVTCHDGRPVIGKSANHVPTHNNCEVCHETTGFIPATFDHAGITEGCIDCHDGVFAIGKDSAPNHPVTNADCGVCHTTDTFTGAGFNHLEGNGDPVTTNCARSGCHGDGATGKSVNHPEPADIDCSNCHTTATFVGGSWEHGPETANVCDTCHSPGGGATPMPATGINGHFETAEQCDSCHTTNRWAPANEYDHANDSKYPVGDHLRPLLGCRDCHRNNSETIDYNSPNKRDPRASYRGFCASCHAGDFEREGDHRGGNNGTIEQNKDCDGSGQNCHRISGSRGNRGY